MIVSLFCYEFPFILLINSFLPDGRKFRKTHNEACCFVFNSACKRLLARLRVIKKSESICINSLFIPFTHFTRSVLSPSPLLCCSAFMMRFLWLLSSKSAGSWGSNSVGHSVATHLLFPNSKVTFSSSLILWVVWSLKAAFPSVSLCRAGTVAGITHIWEDKKLVCEEAGEKAMFPLPQGFVLPFSHVTLPMSKDMEQSAVLQDHQCNWNKLSFGNVEVDTMEEFIDISKPL